MLNQLLKFTLVSSVLLWLRPRWQGLLALTVAVVLVHVLHGEYLEYVQLSGNDAHLVLSYVIKWGALVVVAASYIAFLVLGSRTPSRAKSESARPVTMPRGDKAPTDDGFDFLRQKKRLDNKAEKVISGKPAKRGKF